MALISDASFEPTALDRRWINHKTSVWTEALCFIGFCLINRWNKQKYILLRPMILMLNGCTWIDVHKPSVSVTLRELERRNLKP